MADMKAQVTVDLGGNLPSRAGRYSRAFGKFAQSATAHGRTVQMAGARISQGLDRVGNRYVALATSAGAAGTLRFLGNLDARLRSLGVQANATPERIDAIKDKIFEVANMPQIRVDPSGIMDGVDRIIEKTGDLDLAEENLMNIGLAMSAASARGGDVGAMIADLDQKFAIEGPEAMLATLDSLVNQGKAGAFTLQNMAAQGERVTAAYGLLGRTGPEAAREMGAALQMIRQGVGSAEQAATALEAVIRTLNDAEKAKMLKGAGIQLFDPEDPKRMRSILAIMEDVIRVTEGDPMKISEVFDAEAMRAFSAAVGEYKQTGGLGSFENFLNVDDSGSAIMDDARRNAEGFNRSLQSLMNSAQKYADNKLAGPVQALANAIDSLDPDTVEATMDALAKGALVVGGLVAANKVLKGVSAVVRGARALRGMRRGGGSRTGAAMAGGAAAAGRATPVMVVNWPVGFGAGGAGKGKSGAVGRYSKGHVGAAAAAGAAQSSAAAGAAARSGSLLSRVGSFGKGALGRLGLPIMALMAGADAIDAMLQGDGERAAGAGGRLAGAAGGGALGAAIGSAVPGLGTLIGGLIGGGLGAWGGEEAVRGAYRLLVGVDPENGQVTLRSEGGDGDVEIDAGGMVPAAIARGR